MLLFSLYGTFNPRQEGSDYSKSKLEVKMEDEQRTFNGVGDNRKMVGTLQLAVIVFYTVAGGPFGIEETVRSGGAFYALLGFAIMPFVWSVPEALVTAELGAAYPEASGSVAWVEEAFGPTAGWIQGCLNWVSGATDNAIYPVLFFDYALQVFGHDSEGLDSLTRFIILTLICLVLTFINYRGLSVVGDMSVTICILSLSPFVVFCIVGLFKMDPARLLQLPSGIISSDDDTGAGILPDITYAGILWRPFLNNLFWNLNSFDSAACFAGEVANPGRSFPRAMLGGALLVFFGYMLPLLVALGATESTQHDWEDGYMAKVASEVVGPWLGVWVVFAAGISNLAMFEGEMSSDAFRILGMAERGYLPKIFAERSIYGTPTAGLLVGMCVILAMCVTDLSSLIEMLNLNYSLSLIFEYAAFIKLRVSKPDLERPYRIPLNTLGCCVFLVPPLFMTTVVMLLASNATYAYSMATIFAAIVLYRLRGGQYPVVDGGYTLVEEVEDQELMEGEDIQEQAIR